MRFSYILVVLSFTLSCLVAGANIKALITDATNGVGVSYAMINLTSSGFTSPLWTRTDNMGNVSIGVPNQGEAITMTIDHGKCVCACVYIALCRHR